MYRISAPTNLENRIAVCHVVVPELLRPAGYVFISVSSFVEVFCNHLMAFYKTDNPLINN